MCHVPHSSASALACGSALGFSPGNGYWQGDLKAVAKRVVQAAELGWLPRTKSSDTIQSRFVVSRFPRGIKRGTGEVIDGWQYELFVTNPATERASTGERLVSTRGTPLALLQITVDIPELGAASAHGGHRK